MTYYSKFIKKCGNYIDDVYMKVIDQSIPKLSLKKSKPNS